MPTHIRVTKKVWLQTILLPTFPVLYVEGTDSGSPLDCEARDRERRYQQWSWEHASALAGGHKRKYCYESSAPEAGSCVFGVEHGPWIGERQYSWQADV
jgi:hypothetical protein